MLRSMPVRRFKRGFKLALIKLLVGSKASGVHLSYVGGGSVADLCRRIADIGHKDVLVVTDKALKELGLAELAVWMGLSAEIGAFIAGISIASSPIAQYIAISLKPLRDFFLVVFFFSVGSGLDVAALPQVILPAIVMAAAFLLLKPVVFHVLVRGVCDEPKLAWNLGLRLGQCSEFALLIAFLGLSNGLLSIPAATLIQATTVMTLLVSSYWVVLTLPTPIAIREELRRD